MAVLYLLEQGCTLRKDGETFSVTREGEVLQKVPAVKIEQVVVFGNVNLTTPVIHHLLKEGIDCVFCSSSGKFRGRLVSIPSNFGALRQYQFKASLDAPTATGIAREIVRGKLLNQRTLLMRYRRRRESERVAQVVDEVGKCIHSVESASVLETIVGYEGRGSAVYYRGLREVLKQDLPFDRRVRRPPTDPVNSLLSFGYTLLLHSMEAAVNTVGLDPFIGFLHATAYSRPSLALDLIEEFRPIIIDALVLQLLNTRTITETDFREGEGEKAPALLSDEARKGFVRQYEERVQSKIAYPSVGEVTYRRCFELQVRQLARVLMGREPKYRPFLAK